MEDLWESLFRRALLPIIDAPSSINWRASSAGTVWLFSLEGDIEQEISEDIVQASSGLRPTAEAPALTRVEPTAERLPNIEAGQAIFNQICAACHGPNGEGGEAGVELVGKTFTTADIMTLASYGRNTMPAFSYAYSRDQLHDVATYIIDDLLAR
jgi:mono/diheme cytochrome c family protein